MKSRIKLRKRNVVYFFLAITGALNMAAFQNCSSGVSATPAVSTASQLAITPGPTGNINASAHPSVLMNRTKFLQIQSSLKTSAVLQKYMNTITGVADSLAVYGPPIYNPTLDMYLAPLVNGKINPILNQFLVTAPNNVGAKVPVSPVAGYYEISAAEFDQNLIEFIASCIEYITTAYVFTQDPKYLSELNTWVLAVTNYYDWDERFTPLSGEARTPFQPDPSVYSLVASSSPQLATGQMLVALSMAYDWVNTALPAATLKAISTSINYHANLVYLTAGPAVPGVLNSGFSWWRSTYLQNHNYIGFVGLAAAGAALLTEQPTTAQAWLNLAAADFLKVQTYLPADGATPEGVSYGGVGLSDLLRASDIFSVVMPSVNMLAPVGASSGVSAFWQNAAYFQIYHTTPTSTWNVPSGYTYPFGYEPSTATLFGFNDMNTWAWAGPNAMIRHLASINNNTDLQSFADLLDQYPAANGTSGGWIEMLWYDPNLASTNFALSPSLPLFKNFNIYGEAVSRSSWTDPLGSVVLYRSGSPMGSQVPIYLYAGYSMNGSDGHVHPSAGSFAILGGGSELIRTSGYLGPKFAEYENTLTFDCTSNQSGCSANGQMGQLGQTATALNLPTARLSPAQICTLNPAKYWSELVALQTEYKTLYSVAEPIPATAPSPIANTCSLPFVLETVGYLANFCSGANYSLAPEICQQIPQVQQITQNANWSIPTSETGGVDYVIEDATAAYDPIGIGMQNYSRQFIYLRNHNVLLSITDVSLSKSQTMNLYFHTSFVPTVTAPSSGLHVVNAGGNNAALSMYFFDNTATVTPISQATGGEVGTLQAIKVTATGTSWENVAAFAWAPPVTVSGTTTKGNAATVSYHYNAATSTAPAQYQFTLTGGNLATPLVVTLVPSTQSVQIN